MTDSCSFPSVDSDTTSLVSRSRTIHLRRFSTVSTECFTTYE